MKAIKIFAAAIALFSFAGCLRDSVSPDAKIAYIAVIVNNGNDKNGSVHYYNEETDEIFTDPLTYNLNATYRSIQLLGDRLCLVTNDSDAFINFDIMGQMIGSPKTDNMTAPRFVTTNQNHFFVSNWGAESGGEYNNSFVSVFDKWDYSFVKKLDCGSQAEGIVAYKDRLFVATADGVEIFNTLTTDFVKEPTITASSPQMNHAKRLVVDSLENMWVSFAGGGLLCIDPTSRTVVQEFPDVPVDAEIGAIALTKNGKKMISFFYSDAASPRDGVTVAATDLATGEQTDLIEGNYIITALGVSPFTGNIYIANTPSGGESTLLVFDENGIKKSEKTTGLCTGYISFFGYYYY
jgi:hypothetical protein